MFKNTYQSGLLSIFYSCGSNPLAIWESEVRNGHIKRLTDKEVSSIVLEIVSVNVATTYITCPKRDQVLGIRLPFLVMIVKNLKRYFSFEITVLDHKNMRRRFRVSNFQSTTKIKPFCTTMPIGLSGGWNQIQFNLADFTRRAYGTQFMETLRVQVHANARLRRIYFSDRLYTEDELPQEYKLFMPLDHKTKKVDKKDAHKPSIQKPSVHDSEKERPVALPVTAEAAFEVADEVVEVLPVEEVPVEGGLETEAPQVETPQTEALQAGTETATETQEEATTEDLEEQQDADAELTPAEEAQEPEQTIDDLPLEAPIEAVEEKE